jgi:hypothetical protein
MMVASGKPPSWPSKKMSSSPIGDLTGVLDAEDRDDLGAHRDHRVHLAPRHLVEVADVADRDAVAVHDPCAVDVDRDAGAEAALDRHTRDERVAVVLLGHHVRGEAELAGLGDQRVGVGRDGVEVPDPAVGRHAPVAMQLEGRLDELRVPGRHAAGEGVGVQRRRLGGSVLCSHVPVLSND